MLPETLRVVVQFSNIDADANRSGISFSPAACVSISRFCSPRLCSHQEGHHPQLCCNPAIDQNLMKADNNELRGLLDIRLRLRRCDKRPPKGPCARKNESATRAHLVAEKIWRAQPQHNIPTYSVKDSGWASKGRRRGPSRLQSEHS